MMKNKKIREQQNRKRRKQNKDPLRPIPYYGENLFYDSD